MMYQGLFGVFPFTVSEMEVCTFRDLKKSHKQVYVEHKALDGLGRLQHTGRELETISLTVLIVPLSAISTVGARLTALNLMVRLGNELPLVIGLKYEGLYVLESWEITHKQIHNGVTLSAEVSLSLKEYN